MVYSQRYNIFASILLVFVISTALQAFQHVQLKPRHLTNNFLKLQKVDHIKFRLFAESDNKGPKQQENQAIPRQPPPSSPGLSDSMRQKLLREAQSQGADANVSSGNPILLISIIITALVILGGKGFFYN